MLLQSVPLATKPDISLIILTPMKILQRNLNRSTFVFRRESPAFALSNKLETNILISGKIIKEIPGSVASGAPYIKVPYTSPASLVTPFVLKKR